MIIQAISFITLGLLGGIIKAIVVAKDWKDLVTFWTVRMIALGALMGLVYYFLYSKWSYPNTVMAIIAGYAGSDFIDSLIKRARP